MSNKINDTAWTVEEQYFNTTLSLADKGKVHKHVVEVCHCAVSCGEMGWFWAAAVRHQDLSISLM